MEITPKLIVQIERVARTIAEDLFTDGRGERANRLVMEFGEIRSGNYGGGWVERAIADRVAEHIRSFMLKI